MNMIVADERPHARTGLHIASTHVSRVIRLEMLLAVLVVDHDARALAQTTCGWVRPSVHCLQPRAVPQVEGSDGVKRAAALLGKAQVARTQ